MRRGTLNVTLTENGTLVAKESRKISADIRGDAKITFLVDEGAEVEEGEVLCLLDATDLEDRLEQRELEVVQTQADLDTARTELEIQLTDNEASIEKARIELDKAIKELERYEDGDAPKERRNLETERRALEQGGYRLEAVRRGYGNMQIVEWLKKTGRVEAASDPRGEGSGLVK